MMRGRSPRQGWCVAGPDGWKCVAPWPPTPSGSQLSLGRLGSCWEDWGVRGEGWRVRGEDCGLAATTGISLG